MSNQQIDNLLKSLVGPLLLLPLTFPSIFRGIMLALNGPDSKAVLDPSRASVFCMLARVLLLYLLVVHTLIPAFNLESAKRTEIVGGVVFLCMACMALWARKQPQAETSD